MNLRALLLAGLLLGACGAESPAAGGGAKAVSTVELADVATLDGALTARRGKAVLLNFWAMW